MPLAEKLAEIEPFKTTFLVGLLNRSWPFTLFARRTARTVDLDRAALLQVPLSRSARRWRCRPPSAGSGSSARQACNSCSACAVGCGSQAIDRDGRIDQRECMLCLDCLVLYTDAHSCPPLSLERRRREKAGLPLTPVGGQRLLHPADRGRRSAGRGARRGGRGARSPRSTVGSDDADRPRGPGVAGLVVGAPADRRSPSSPLAGGARPVMEGARCRARGGCGGPRRAGARHRRP